jgi:hypothetical protein
LCGDDGMNLYHLVVHLVHPSAVSGGKENRGLATVASAYPPPHHGWQGDPPLWPELEWRQSPPSTSSPPRVLVRAAAQWWATEHELAPVVPRDERDVT